MQYQCVGRLGRSMAPWHTSRPPTLRRVVIARASPEKSSTDEMKGGLDPYLEVAVPKDQRPVNQLAELKQDPLYSWMNCGTAHSASSAMLTYRLPRVEPTRVWVVRVTCPTFRVPPTRVRPGPHPVQPLEWFLSGTTGALVVVAVVVIRIYLGWSYVGDRLLSAAVPYEETGWYDGEMFVKPPEVLMRDRLLGTYEVKPVLSKLRTTLLGSAGLLLTTAVLLFGLIKAGSDADGMYGRGAARVPRQVLSDGVLYSARVSDLAQLATDDEAAAAEAEAQGSIPGYCGDRALRAFAGGQYCTKFDR
ncbi:hypothetical protein VOLCADRAFT_98713 [Volvox carteri f. nagariensis]|uniref:Uncharacterized protein n=1 Tax=Volvox carteri f. nagariensis TaxID=3068 RepID=D8UG32_VOLCA|nr:uncharacterized protein VOLCADRAFT_98713 [Volvox carteri f. nagariensis]EFJ41307.1 hypothetical protein VOLCADRAFT_98713 [Volvox carteri f. nagariensis]|eukprot:XP_002957641.1 hypothetical protein VOLCADRAFT_98713 [Volvox carteri f. nagariensis]